ncbi:response regulator [Uliginosibacterium sp. 31-16]|uniref:response regulator n=1 Tax=Uliginosibacterium sp. 31-16 TaxID=3068315 RepID=UPI00273F623B|nr:response regulator [Uliginosibacterium sp. 31-16]MDP5238539.1 response regulator [Uliginosibacterium sp. 31-16]
MKAYEDHSAAKQEGHVLVVDDVATTRAIHNLILARNFEVKNAASGQEALDLCAERIPDLILLDVEMPGLNGFETCRKLREHYDIPIIFATAHESLEEHLKAFDAGGTDLCVKPVSAEILIRKVRLAIRQWRERTELKTRQESLKAQADLYQSGMSDRRLLLQFTRIALGCDNYEQLARNFLHACRLFGAQCCIAIRHDDSESAWSAEGSATALERSVLTQIAGMGPLVQFKNRLAINQDRLSVVVSNMPEENSDEAVRIRDNMSMLVDMAAAIADKLAQQHTTPVSSKDTPDHQRKTLADARLLVQELFDRLDNAYDLMATDKQQEERITEAVRVPLERLIALLEESFGLDPAA